jgi:hypothetical protein
MKRGDSRSALVVSKNKEIAAFRMDCRVIWRGDDVFAPVARANREGDKWSAVQQFSDAGNHEAILLQRRTQLKLVGMARCAVR